MKNNALRMTRSFYNIQVYMYTLVFLKFSKNIALLMNEKVGFTELSFLCTKIYLLSTALYAIPFYFKSARIKKFFFSNIIVENAEFKHVI